MNGQNYSEPQEEAENRKFQSRMEWLKTVYDYYKHFMTIAFASIATVAAVAALVSEAIKTSTFGAEAPLVPKLLVGAAILLRPV